MIQPPTRPEFLLRKLDHPAYGMSMIVGALGQIMFLGQQFGGRTWSYFAAVGIAAFAEMCMAAAGDWSLEHRTQRRAWLPLLLLGLGVALYAATLNVTHFWANSQSMALMFGGASMVGFLLHVINGHIKVAAYLRAADAYEATRVAEVASTDATRRPKSKATQRPGDPGEKRPGNATQVATAATRPDPTGDPIRTTQATQHDDPAPRPVLRAVSDPRPNDDDPDVSDLLEPARLIIREIGRVPAREALASELRTRGYSVGGKRRHAIHRAMHTEFGSTSTAHETPVAATQTDAVAATGTNGGGDR